MVKQPGLPGKLQKSAGIIIPVEGGKSNLFRRKTRWRRLLPTKKGFCATCTLIDPPGYDTIIQLTDVNG